MSGCHNNEMLEVESLARQSLEHLLEHAQDGIEKCFERIEKLDKSFEYQSIHNKSIQESNKIIIKKIEELEKWKEVAIEKNIQDVDRLRKLEKTIPNSNQFKNPYKCPMCQGLGKVGVCGNEVGTYIEVQECNACKGTSIVWG